MKQFRSLAYDTGKSEGRPRLQLSPENIIDDYRGGESELSIARRLGVSRNVVRRRLLEAGIAIRSISEANVLRMAKMTFEQRQALTQASHKGAKNIPSKRRREMLEQAAKTRTKTVGLGERELILALRQLGLPCEEQTPCGIYNIDITVGTVAVELFTLPWQCKAKRRFPKRFKYVRDHGYTLIAICFRRISQFLAKLDDLVLLIKQTYRLPTGRRKHRMIRCGSERFARGRNERGHLTAIPTAEHFFYVVEDLHG